MSTRILSLTTAVVIAALAAVPAHAQGGFEFGGFGSYTQFDTSLALKERAGAGARLTLISGYGWSTFILEAEGGYSEQKLGPVSMKYIPARARLLYALPLGSTASLLIGGGGVRNEYMADSTHANDWGYTALAGLVIGALQLSGLTFKLSLLLVTVTGGNVLFLLALTAVVCILLGMSLPTTVVYITLAVLVEGAIFALTFPLVGFWKWLDRKGEEPSTPTKMAIGMFLTALAYYVMYFAGKAGGDVGRVSPLWLIGAYAIISLGELMLSPMGLSLVSKVAPVRMRAFMMGGWFVATAIGNKLTAVGVYWDDWLHSTFFAVVGTMALGTAVLLLFLLKGLKKAMPGV